jgi:hypothetical protein
MSTNKKLSAVISIGGTVAESLKGAFGDVKGKFAEIGKTVDKLKKQQRELSTDIMKGARQGTTTLEKWRSEYAKVTAQIEKAKKAQDRLVASQKFKDKVGKVNGYLHSAAGYSAAAGGTIAVGATATFKRASDYATGVARLKGLGFDEKTTDETIKVAKGLKAYGVDQNEKLDLITDAMTVLKDKDHASLVMPMLTKMKFASHMYEHGDEMESSFMGMLKIIEKLGGTKDTASFGKYGNAIWKIVAATQGKVQADEWNHFLSTGGSAAKFVLRNPENGFAQMEPLVQEYGGDKTGTQLSGFMSSFYYGRTTKKAIEQRKAFGLVPQNVSLSAGKNGEYAYDPKFLKGNEELKEGKLLDWFEDTIVSGLKAKKIDINNANESLDAIAKLGGSKKDTEILQNMYMLLYQGNGKEAIKGNKRAHDLDTSTEDFKKTPEGKRLEMMRAYHDSMLNFGEAAAPLFVKAMSKITSALEGVTKFAEAHPTLFKDIAIGVTAFGGALLIAVPVLGVAAGIMSTIAAVKLARAASEVSAVTRELSGVEGAAAAASGGVMGFIGKLGLAGMLVGTALTVAKAAGLPDTDKTKAEADMRNGKWLAASADAPAWPFIKAYGKHLLGHSNDEIADGFAGKTPPVGSKTPPAVPASKAAQPTVPPISIDSVNVYAHPNQSTQEIAAEVIKQVNQQNAKKSRSIMFDGATQ